MNLTALVQDIDKVCPRPRLHACKSPRMVIAEASLEVKNWTTVIAAPVEVLRPNYYP
jgi:hypothetical protein